MPAVQSGGTAGGKGDKNPGGQASKVTSQRRQGQGRAACYLRNKSVKLDRVRACRSDSKLVPVTAVGGPRRNPVDADVRFHTQYRLVLQLGRHLDSARTAAGGGASARGRDVEPGC